MSSIDSFKLDPSLHGPAKNTRRKRFLAISIAALAVLSVAMGVSFLGTTGTTGVTVTSSGSSDYVFPVTGEGIPGMTEGVKKAVKALEFGTTENSPTLPSLGEPTVGTAGKVAASGDLALVDASSETLGSATELIVNVYVTNLSGLSLDYSSFALPVTVYKATCENAAEKKCGETSAKWTVDSEVSSEAAGLFLTNTEGTFSFRVKGAAHQFLDIAMNEGGSYYLSKVAAGGALGPEFYFTAQAV